MKHKAIVYVDTNGTHLHQIYTGLFLLEKEQKISIKLRQGKSTTKGRGNRQIIAIDIKHKDSKLYKRCIFDMQDSQKISLLDNFNNIDYYFKRSYSERELNYLNSKDKSKIIPFGLNYQALLPKGNRVITRTLLEYLSKPYNPFSGKNRFHAENIVDCFLYEYTNKRLNLIPYSDIENDASRIPDKKILFQSRLWPEESTDPRNREDVKEVNDQRIKLIQSLEREFGNSFIGGLQPTSHAKEHYPHLLTPVRSKRQPYIKTMKECMIAINSPGLLDSMGWKLAEYVAAGKCIISTPISATLPGNFASPQNFLEYTTVDECLEACHTLVSDADFALEMMTQNKQYYNQYVRPDSIMENCIQATLGG